MSNFITSLSIPYNAIFGSNEANPNNKDKTPKETIKHTLENFYKTITIKDNSDCFVAEEGYHVNEKYVQLLCQKFANLSEKFSLSEAYIAPYHDKEKQEAYIAFGSKETGLIHTAKFTDFKNGSMMSFQMIQNLSKESANINENSNQNILENVRSIIKTDLTQIKDYTSKNFPVTIQLKKIESEDGKYSYLEKFNPQVKSRSQLRESRTVNMRFETQRSYLTSVPKIKKLVEAGSTILILKDVPKSKFCNIVNESLKQLDSKEQKLEVINTYKLALKIVQENMNHAGSNSFHNYDYYGKYNENLLLQLLDNKTTCIEINGKRINNIILPQNNTEGSNEERSASIDIYKDNPKNLLEQICFHEKAFGNNKLSFWGTNYTESAKEIRQMLDDESLKIKHPQNESKSVTASTSQKSFFSKLQDQVKRTFARF